MSSDVTQDTSPFRDCRIPGCERDPIAYGNYCEMHTREILRDSLDYARKEGPADWTHSYDDKDGGHNDK